MSETKRYPFTSLAVLVPLLLAYGGGGGKSGQSYALVFAFLGTLFLLQAFLYSRTSSKVPIPYFWLFFLWCALVLINAPPLYPHLLTLSKILAYILFCSFFLQEDQKEGAIPLSLLFARVIIVCALLELVYPLLKGNPSYSALLLAAGSVFAYFHSQLKDQSLLWKIGFRIIALVLAIGVLYSHSRGVILGVILAAAIFLPRQAKFFGFTLLVLAAVGLWVLRHEWFQLVVLKVLPDDPGFTWGRLSIWKTAVSAINDHWFWGVGLGNFESAYRLHQLPAGPIFGLFYQRSTPFAHNDYLQLAVEAGLPALVLFVWGGWVCWKRLPAVKQLGPIAQGACAVVLVFMVNSLFGFSLFLPFNGLVAAGCVGTLAAAFPKQPPSRIFSGSNRAVISAVVMFFILFLGFNGLAERALKQGRVDLATRLMPIRSDLWYERALQNPGSSVESLLQAVRWNSQDPFIWSRLAREGMLDPAFPREKVEESFEKSEVWGPKHAPFWIDHGLYLLQTNRPAEAREKFLQASRLEPNTPLPFYGLGLVCLNEQKRPEAIDLLTKAMEIKQRFNIGTTSQQTASAYTSYLFSVDEEKVKALIQQIKKSSVL